MQQPWLPHPSFRRHGLVAVILILIVVIPLLIGGQDVLAPIKDISPALIVFFLLLLAARWYCIAWRNQILFFAQGHLVRKRDLLGINLACTLSDETTYGTATPALWIYSFSKLNIKGSRAAACGLLISAINIIALTTLFPVILVGYLIISAESLSAPVLLIGLALLLITGLFLYCLFNERFIGWITRLPIEKILPKRLRPSLIEIRQALWSALQKSRQIYPATYLLLLLLSIINWTIRLSITYLAILMIGQHLPWFTAALIHFVGAVTGMLIPLPGGFPAIDLSITTLLNQHFSLTDSLSILLLWRLMSLYTNLLAGGMALFWIISGRLKQSR